MRKERAMTQTDKARTGVRMPSGCIVEGTLSIAYHDGRETAWALVGMSPDELRSLASDLNDLAYRVERAELALTTPMTPEEASKAVAECNAAPPLPRDQIDAIVTSVTSCPASPLAGEGEG